MSTLSFEPVFKGCTLFITFTLAGCNVSADVPPRPYILPAVHTPTPTRIQPVAKLTVLNNKDIVDLPAVNVYAIAPK